MQQLSQDWMTKGFLSEVLTDDKNVFDVLSKDPILGNKLTLIKC